LPVPHRENLHSFPREARDAVVPPRPPFTLSQYAASAAGAKKRPRERDLGFVHNRLGVQRHLKRTSVAPDRRGSHPIGEWIPS
jgi:hypothetical protein